MGDWTSSTYIISQILVILAYGAIAVTYLVKKRGIILLLVISYSVLTGVGFILLDAWAGVGVSAVAIFRDSVSFFINKKRKPENKNKTTNWDWVLLTLWLSIFTVITIFTQNGILSWFALLGAFVFTISVWQKNVLAYKILGIFVGIFWTIYNFYVHNLFGVLLEIVLLAAVTVGLILYIKNMKSKKVKLAENHPKDIEKPQLEEAVKQEIGEE